MLHSRPADQELHYPGQQHVSAPNQGLSSYGDEKAASGTPKKKRKKEEVILQAASAAWLRS